MIVVVACFRSETAWIKTTPAMQVVRVRPGAPAGFERAVTAAGPIDLLVSAGFCGGLDPSLKLGELILATEIIHRGRTIRIAPALLKRAQAALDRGGVAYRPGPIVTAPRVIATHADKAGLHADTGAVGVEMEAGILAAWAQTREIPFLAVKSVLDPVDAELPLRTGWDAVRRPGAAIRVGRAARNAGKALGIGVGIVAQEFGGAK